MEPNINLYETYTPGIQEDRLNKEIAPAERITDATILETPSSFIIEVEMPRVAVGDCNIKIEDGVLTISAKGIADLQLDLVYIAKTKFRHGIFYRIFLSLGWYGDDDVYLTCDHRMLTVYISKNRLLEYFESDKGIN